jgi:NADPH2:quinone reductase
MRAIQVTRFGTPEVLVSTTLPEPVAGPGQVLINVEFANITFVDTQIRAGKPPNPAMLPPLPLVPGNGVGGLVASVGPSVDQTLIGRRVIATTGGSGGYAERVAVDAGALIGVPNGLGLAEAVALLADGRTAIALMRAAEVQTDETVLVEAAAGGVGSLLVQLARSAGARVIGAAGGPRKLALASELGASVTVDYTDPLWPDRLRAELNGETVDVVFDGVGGAIGRAAFDLLAAGGRLWAFGLASGASAQIPEGEAARRGVRVIWGPQAKPQDMLELTRAALVEAAAGRLRPVIGQTFPLEQAAAAHAAIEARTTLGKTLLSTVTDDTSGAG